MTRQKNRRKDILNRIESRCKIIDMGFFLDGQPSPCHLWEGATSGTGKGGYYGKISIDGVMCMVHKVVYTHYYGIIPTTKQIDHLCCNRNCCNPLHLELVSHQENQRRRDQRKK